MGIFDQLESQCGEIAGKVGIPPETVQSISAGLQQKMSQEGLGHVEAMESVAAEHGIPVEKVQELLSHCGSEQDVMGSLSSFAGGFLKG